MRDELILNVNDDDATRYVVSRILTKAGYRVTEVATGFEALASVRRERPQLVVLDVQLPDISGLEVCRRLKADPRTADLPVLQTSATFITADRKVEGLDSGADGYLAQPIEPPELLATVRALIRANSAEQQVREAAIEWQQTFDALVEPAVVVDADGTLSRVNKAARDLAGGHDVTGWGIGDAMSQLLGGTTVDWLHAARHSRRRETMVIPTDERWFEVSVDPVIDPDSGEPHRFVVIVSDVSAQRALIEHERRRASELAEANARKDQFLAMLAHELRNPLNAIATANALAGRLPAADPRHEWVRDTITRQSGHLSRMVEDLLEASRLSRGRVQLQMKRINLGKTLADSIEAARSATDSRRQKLRVSIPHQPLLMRGDPLRLEQVFVNVINNASKYSEAGTEITIKCVAMSPDRAEIRVSDHGVGIPREHLEAVFEPFMQVDQSLARTLGGIGIGLTLARGLIEQHGGTIRALSDGPGKGTTVVIECPLAAVSESLVDEPTAAANDAAGSLSVLIIDDNRDAAALLQSLLETKRHSVHLATDGPSGLDAALSLLPDVALIDIGLPGIDGYQVAASLRASATARNMCLVAITGYGRPEDRARALESGFNHYIVKPLRVEELDRVLSAAASRMTGAGGVTP